MRIRPDQMTGRGEPQRHLESDAIDDERQQHDADRERPEADSRELALLGLGQTKLHPPRVYRKRAEDEAKGSRNQRGETHRESLLGLG